MKLTAISLTQPWATLVAIGEKCIETRSWKTFHSGLLYIHASKGFPSDAKALCETEPFKSALARHGFNSWKDLPTGSIVGSVILKGCVPTSVLTHNIDAKEKAFGDYSAGRYGWYLNGGGMLPNPVPCKGALSLWAIPEDVAAILSGANGGAK